MFRLPVLVALALVPWGPTAQPDVRVRTLPAVPPLTAVGDLPTGAVFQPSGLAGPCMVVAPLHDPQEPYRVYGARQFPRPFDWYPAGASYYDPPLTTSMALGVGVPAVSALSDLPRDVWVVDLKDATLFRLPAATLVRPVAAVRVSVKIGPAVSPADDPQP